jgi:hypothetical protein
MARKHARMHRCQHYLTQVQYHALNTLSTESGVGVSEHMRRALDSYFENSERWPHKEAARRHLTGVAHANTQ